LRSQTKLEQLWPSNKFGTRRLKKKNFEISIKTEATLAQQQVLNYTNEEKTLKSQSKLKQP
jgi:hypothetical protein